MMNNLEAKDLYVLTKIDRLIIPFSSFVLGFLLTGSNQWPVVILSLLTILFVYASAATLNDIVDMHIDSISNPRRPIPSGKLGKTGALAFFLIFAFIGLYIGYSVSLSYGKPLFFYGTIFEIMAGLLYARFLSKHFIMANGTLGITHGVVPLLLGFNLFGGVFSTNVLVIAGGLWLLLFMTYNLKDLKDIEGDRLERKTLPTIFGMNEAIRLNVFFLYLTIPIAVIVFLVDRRSWQSLAGSVFFGLGLVVLGQYLSKAENKHDFIFVLNAYRFLMSLFILSLAL